MAQKRPEYRTNAWCGTCALFAAIPPDDFDAFHLPLHACFPVAGGGFPVRNAGVPGSDAAPLEMGAEYYERGPVFPF